jgi:hypothetical protein
VPPGGKFGAFVAVPAHDATFTGFPVYLGAIKIVDAGETTLVMLRFIPGATAYIFALML